MNAEQIAHAMMCVRLKIRVDERQHTKLCLDPGEPWEKQRALINEAADRIVLGVEIISALKDLRRKLS